MNSVRLDSVCDIIMGQAPPGDSYNLQSRGSPLIAGAGDFFQGSIRVKKFTTSPTKISRPGDIVLGIRASIGERVIADRSYCLGRGVAALRPGQRLTDRYLWHWIARFRNELSAKGKGATFLQVNRNDIGEMPIMVPPLGEQRRIAAILDQADALRTQRRATLITLDELAKATLELSARSTDSNFYRRLGDFIQIGTGGTPSRTVSAYFEGSIPWVKTTEVRGRIIRSTAENITEKAIADTNCQIYPVGSIVIAMYGQGATRGRCAVLGVPAATNQACAVLSPNSNYRTEYVFTKLMSEYDRLRGAARGGNQPNLNLSIIKDFEIPIPPKEVQDRLADRLNAIDSLRTTHRASLAELDALFASLQHRAFRGEL